MSKYPNLNNAPIAEAIFSIDVVPSQECDLECLQKICAQLNDVYKTEPEEWAAFQGAFKVADGEISSSHSSEKLGYIIKSEDEKSILHLGKRSIILNKLRPYTSWQDISSQFEDAWNKYAEAVIPSTINRVGVRYINSFEIPVENWTENLLMHSVLNTENEFDDSSMSMGEVFSRYVLRSDRYVAESIVMMNIKAVGTDKLAVVMDIDVKSIDKISNYSGYYEIKDVVDRLRDFKNQIFFSNVPKAKELFS